jgi:hypothetical protein
MQTCQLSSLLTAEQGYGCSAVRLSGFKHILNGQVGEEQGKDNKEKGSSRHVGHIVAIHFLDPLL